MSEAANRKRSTHGLPAQALDEFNQNLFERDPVQRVFGLGRVHVRGDVKCKNRSIRFFVVMLAQKSSCETNEKKAIPENGLSTFDLWLPDLGSNQGQPD